MIKDEDTKREVVIMTLKINILKTLETLKTMNQEFEILEYRKIINFCKILICIKKK